MLSHSSSSSSSTTITPPSFRQILDLGKQRLTDAKTTLVDHEKMVSVNKNRSFFDK
jgi:hypothetical protein